jgi:hypothetical protein
MTEEFNHKHYNYKWTKGFLLATFICAILLFGAVFAQVSYTGNLNTNNWSNGYPVNSLDCWKGGDPNCSPGTPYVRPDGQINFSYSATELYQARAIADVLPNSGTGLMVTGFQYNWRSKNGNGWDDGRLDTLQAYVQMYSKSGQWIEAQTYSLNFLHDWTDFSWSGNFTKERRGSDLGTILYGFYGVDNNYWMGPYGPEVTNVSFSLRYQPDPCVVNPLYSTQCPKFNETISNMNSLSPIVSSTINTFATATSTETTSVINLVADPTKTSVNVTTTMNEVVPLASDFSRTITPDRQSSVNFALSNSRLQRENAESFAMSLRNAGPQQQTSITNQSSNLSNALDIISRNRQQQQTFENQAVRQATTTAQNIAVSSMTEASNIASMSFEAGVTISATNTSQATPANVTSNAIQTLPLRLPSQASTNVAVASQQQQQSNQQIITNSIVQIENTQAAVAQDFSAGSISVQQQPPVQVQQVQAQQELSFQIIMPVIIQQSETPKQEEIKIETVSNVPVTVQFEEPKIEIPEFKPPAIAVQNEESIQPIVEIELPKVIAIEVQQMLPPQQAQIISEPIITASISLYVPPEQSKEEIVIPKFVLPKLDAMNIEPEQQKQEILAPPQAPVFAQQEQPVQIEQPIQTTSIAPIVITPVITESVASVIQNIDVQVQPKQDVIISAPVTQVETIATASNFTTDKTNPINEIIENKQTAESERKEPIQTTAVNRNTQNNEAAGNVDISSIATQPPGFNQYASLVLRDAAFYAPKEIYRGQRTVDNARALRQLASDRLHQEMVNQQYLPR